MGTIKKIVLWGFDRASWQWDLLCILIVCFIFLTPKSWYEDREPSVPNRGTDFTVIKKDKAGNEAAK